MLAPLVAVLCGLTLGSIAGGSLSNAFRSRLRWPVLLGAGLSIPTVIAYVAPDGADNVAWIAALTVSHILLIAFLLSNRNIAGFALIALGITANALVIVANGNMPVSAAAAERAGITTDVEDGTLKHEALTEEARLGPLGDTIPVPLARQVWSVGDVLLLAGFFQLAFGQVRPAGPTWIASGRKLSEP